MAYGLPNITSSHLTALKRSRTILKARYGSTSSRVRACEKEIRDIQYWTEKFPSEKTFIVYYDTCDRNGNPNGDYDKEWAYATSRYDAAITVAKRNWNVFCITDVLLDKYVNR